jgi:hypothetical protein
MKKFQLLLVLLFIIPMFIPVQAIAADVTLAWDHNDPLPEGYRIFLRQDSGSYNYTSPAWQGPENTATINNLYGIPMIESTYFFVVRAYLEDLESADSEEVFFTIDRTPPLKITSIQAAYDRAQSAISLSFVQPSPDRAKYWKVFYTFTSGQDYVEFDTIFNTGQAEPSLTTAFTAVPEGERKTVYFAVVGFFDDESFSENSAEVAVDINRIVLTPPANITIKVVIPVE